MSNGNVPVQPPVPFADFEFTFDPALSNLFPPQPPLPPSAELFSASETTDLLGFLDNFNWEFDTVEPEQSTHQSTVLPPYSNPHLDTEPSVRQRPNTRSRGHFTPADILDSPVEANDTRGSHAHPSTPNNNNAPSDLSPSSSTRPKTLLSTPQKRLNHIMSEQKRRNAIRDGYAQLIALLSPAGTPPGAGMPTRGRPKGSGSRGKGRSKGKSGVLFRAVEYCRWLEENRDALKAEVDRLEAAAGISPVHG